MPDNTWHSELLMALHSALTAHFASDPNAFVGTNLMVRDTGRKRAGTLVPDLLVAFGVPKRARRSYEVREEGKVPDFVLEVASRGTFKHDLGRKKDAYERLGVQEYCVFDPVRGMHRPRLQLYRLEAGAYEPVRFRGTPDGPVVVTSATLGVELRFEENKLRLWDPGGQAYLLKSAVEHRQGIEERALRVAAEERADQAERRADQAERRADQAERRAETETRARRKAEAELAELREWVRRNA